MPHQLTNPLFDHATNQTSPAGMESSDCPTTSTTDQKRQAISSQDGTYNSRFEGIGAIGLQAFTCGKRQLNHPSTVDLIEPDRLSRQGQLFDQQLTVTRYELRIVTNMTGKVELRIASRAHPATARHYSGPNQAGNRPVGALPLDCHKTSHDHG